MPSAVRVTLFAILAACRFDAPPEATDVDGSLDSTATPDASPIDAGPIVVRNPVREGCADPGVLRDGDRWYLTCTGGSGGNLFPIYESTDLLTWARVGWIFPAGTGPTWASGNYWAPELHKIGGNYVAYFSARNGEKNAVGAASASSVLGPYADRGAALVPRATSTIDAHVMVAPDATPYLYFKLEGDPDTIWARALTADGLALTNVPSTKLLSVTEPWEKGVVEAPWVIESGGTYYLFYSGAAYCNSSYAVGVARAKSPLGPFEKKPAPILGSGTRWVGPGHNAVTRGPDGRDYLVYHAYALADGTPACAALPGDNNKRHTLIDQVVIENGWPRVISSL
ncbi:MAG TPA: glycoside hydrolase family 43 protein [Kofleriaceae bacterium]